MKIQIAGVGCPRCRELERVVMSACVKLDLPAEIEHIYDAKQFARLGVRLTPAAVIEGKVVLAGRVPTQSEMEKILYEIKQKGGD